MWRQSILILERRIKLESGKQDLHLCICNRVRWILNHQVLGVLMLWSDIIDDIQGWAPITASWDADCANNMKIKYLCICLSVFSLLCGFWTFLLSFMPMTAQALSFCLLIVIFLISWMEPRSVRFFAWILINEAWNTLIYYQGQTRMMWLIFSLESIQWNLWELKINVNKSRPIWQNPIKPVVDVISGGFFLFEREQDLLYKNYCLLCSPQK